MATAPTPPPAEAELSAGTAQTPTSVDNQDPLKLQDVSRNATTSASDTVSAREDAIVAGAEKGLDVTDDGSQYVTGWKLVIIVACMTLACFLMLLDTMVISTAIPRITDEFHSLVDVGWYASAYQLAMSAPQPLIGKVYTHFQTKWTFFACFAIFELGSVLCGAAQSSTMLIVGRAVAGLGAAGITNGAITIVASCAPLEKRASLFGLIMGVHQLGLVIGPIIGGAFTSSSTWRWSFYINLPLGIPVILGVLFLTIPEQTPKKPTLQVLPELHRYLDLVGFALFAPTVIQLLLALQYAGNQFAWDSSQIIGLFCGAGATCVVWLYWNYRKGDAALLPPAMIGRRTVWAAATFSASQMVVIYGTLYYLPIYFQAINNVSAILSGVYIMPMILPQLVMATLAGAILQMTGYVIPLAIFSSVLFSVGSGLLSMLLPNTSVGQWVGYQILSGVGSGAGMPLAIIAIQGVTTGEELASGMAFLGFSQALFPAVFFPVCNLILVESLRTQIPKQAPGVDPDVVIRYGATGFRTILGEEDLSGVLTAYANSINRVFYLVAGFAALSGVILWGMGWQDLRKKVDAGDASTGDAPAETMTMASPTDEKTNS